MSSKKWVAGVDGAQKGWVVAFMPLRKGKGAYLERFESFLEVKKSTKDLNCLAVAVDMPIGLLDKQNKALIVKYAED